MSTRAHVALLIAVLLAFFVMSAYLAGLEDDPVHKIMDRMDQEHDRVRWPTVPAVEPEKAGRVG